MKDKDSLNLKYFICSTSIIKILWNKESKSSLSFDLNTIHGKIDKINKNEQIKCDKIVVPIVDIDMMSCDDGRRGRMVVV